MRKYLLIIGDILAIAIVTFIGFATHNEASLAFLPRMLASFIPLTVAWLLLAPWFGLFKPDVTSNFKQLWRPLLAMLYAAPFAAFLRGLILDGPVNTTFVLVLIATSAFGMLIWRGIYLLLTRNR
jgi:flagellar biosynthesis protein FliQ